MYRGKTVPPPRENCTPPCHRPPHAATATTAATAATTATAGPGATAGATAARWAHHCALGRLYGVRTMVVGASGVHVCAHATINIANTPRRKGQAPTPPPAYWAARVGDFFVHGEKVFYRSAKLKRLKEYSPEKFTHPGHRGRAHQPNRKKACLFIQFFC